jgi:pyruvate dehydrogenase E1 component alpha subunit
MNMASLWGLPVIYIIENNGYAMGTSINRATYDTNFSNRGLPFGIIGTEVDAMDLFDVYKKIKIARNYCLSEKRPVLLEMKTYRYRGHSMSDPGNYRTKDEVDNYKKLDPIERVMQHLINNNIATADECEKITDDIIQRMRVVAKEAIEAKEPGKEELYTDVYSE